MTQAVARVATVDGTVKIDAIETPIEPIIVFIVKKIQ